jgi:hypothetical protein
VHHLHNLLQIPVVGLCGCNPYGISVLNTYQYQNGVQVGRANPQKDQREESNDIAKDNPTLHLQWIGLQPTHIKTLDPPKSIFQALAELEKEAFEISFARRSSFCAARIQSQAATQGSVSHERVQS